jgi:hypothetical protein
VLRWNVRRDEPVDVLHHFLGGSRQKVGELSCPFGFHGEHVDQRRVIGVCGDDRHGILLCKVPDNTVALM